MFSYFLWKLSMQVLVSRSISLYFGPRANPFWIQFRNILVSILRHQSSSDFVFILHAIIMDFWHRCIISDILVPWSGRFLRTFVARFLLVPAYIQSSGFCGAQFLEPLLCVNEICHVRSRAASFVLISNSLRVRSSLRCSNSLSSLSLSLSLRCSCHAVTFKSQQNSAEMLFDSYLILSPLQGILCSKQNLIQCLWIFLD